MHPIDPAWLALVATIVGGAVLVGKALGVLDALAKAVEKLADAHTDTSTTVARHSERLEGHEKRLDGHDDLLKELTR